MTMIEKYGESEAVIEQNESRSEGERLQAEKINTWVEESVKYFMTEDMDTKISHINSFTKAGTKEALEELGVCCLHEMKNSNFMLFTFNAKKIPVNLKSPVPEENNKNSAVFLLKSWINQINLEQISEQIIGLRIEKGVNVDMNKLGKKAIKAMERLLRHNGKTLNDRDINHPFMTIIGDHGMPSSIVFSLPVLLSPEGRIRYIYDKGNKKNRK
jgi:hypothetical protein